MNNKRARRELRGGGGVAGGKNATRYLWDLSRKDGVPLLFLVGRVCNKEILALSTGGSVQIFSCLRDVVPVVKHFSARIPILSTLTKNPSPAHLRLLY